MAWEDIGLADPRATTIALNAANTYDRLGSPEGDLSLGIAVVYLSVAAKSNASYHAFQQAQAYIKQDISRPVPEHLRNAPTKLAKELNHGKDYKYAHDYQHAFEPEQQYLPNNMKEPSWYQPTDRGLEQKIATRMEYFHQQRQNNPQKD